MYQPFCVSNSVPISLSFHLSTAYSSYHYELLAVLLFFLSFIKKKNDRKKNRSLVLWCFFFSLSPLVLSLLHSLVFNIGQRRHTDRSTPFYQLHSLPAVMYFSNCSPPKKNYLSNTKFFPPLSLSLSFT